MKNRIEEGAFEEIAARVLKSLAIEQNAGGSRVWCT